MDPNKIIEIIGAYNDDPRSFTDQEAELIALLAKSIGADFRRDVHLKPKSAEKLMFNMADVGLLGMLPNEWEPRSRGESIFGKTTGEKMAGGAGSLLGMAAGGYGLVKGARGLKNLVSNPEFLSGIKNPFGNAYQGIRSGIGSAYEGTRSGLRGGLERMNII